MHNGVHAGNGLLDTRSGGQIALHPLDRGTGVGAGVSGQDAHPVTLRCQPSDDVPAEVAGPAGDEDGSMIPPYVNVQEECDVNVWLPPTTRRDTWV